MIYLVTEVNKLYTIGHSIRLINTKYYVAIKPSSRQRPSKLSIPSYSNNDKNKVRISGSDMNFLVKHDVFSHKNTYDFEDL